MGRTEANNGITRRDFVKGLAAGAAASAWSRSCPAESSLPPQLTPRRRTSAKRGTASILMAWQRI